MKHIRLATEEEIKKISGRSDILPGHTQVLAMDSVQGDPDFAVVRNPVEADPMLWSAGTNDVKRAKFMWGLEERLLGGGCDRYYVQVDAKDERWQRVIENWGFQRVSPVAEYRYLRVIK